MPRQVDAFIFLGVFGPGGVAGHAPAAAWVFWASTLLLVVVIVGVILHPHLLQVRAVCVRLLVLVCIRLTRRSRASITSSSGCTPLRPTVTGEIPCSFENVAKFTHRTLEPPATLSRLLNPSFVSSSSLWPG